MPTVMDRITDFFKPKKPYQQRQGATKTPVDGTSTTGSNGAKESSTPSAASKNKPAAKKVAAKAKSGAKKAAASKAKPAKRAAKAKPGAKKTAKANVAGKAKTREQLNKEAGRLKIPGRTKMTKAQLERAIAKAKKK